MVTKYFITNDDQMWQGSDHTFLTAEPMSMDGQCKEHQGEETNTGL